VHLTLGILRTSQAVSYALAFFWLDGFAVPAPAQVTQTVGWPPPLGQVLFCEQKTGFAGFQVRLLGKVGFSPPFLWLVRSFGFSRCLFYRCFSWLVAWL